MLGLVLDWTDELLKTHRDRRAILTSHSLLCTQVQCPETLWAEFSNQGRDTYEALKDNENLFLMQCGHAAASFQQPRRSDTFDGHTIHTLLANYQRGEDCPTECGLGWLRIMTFVPARDEIRIRTYSPWLGEYRSDPCIDGSDCHEFTLDYDMNGGVPFDLIDLRTLVPSGGDVCAPWPGGQPGGRYEWYVDVTNGTEWSTGPRWRFDSSGACATAADCEDGDSCTVDRCETSRCTREHLTDCCSSDGDCDDGNSCTSDVCDGGTCAHTDNTLDCDDGDPCTENDTCAAGLCAGGPRVCDDGNACTADRCSDGVCEHIYEPSTDCCTVSTDCDDQDPCTQDICGSSKNCFNVRDATCCNVDADCDDGDACTVDLCPRNRAALVLDGQSGFVVTGQHYTGGGRSELHGVTAPRFTVSCWFLWEGAGELSRTAGYIYNPFDVGGITAHPLVTTGHRDNDLRDDLGVAYFLGIDESGVLAADLEAHATEQDPGANYPVRGRTPVSVGNWHHAAVTYDGNCWQLYLDGQPETDGDVCPGVLPAIDSRYETGIGTSRHEERWLEGYFDGRIDEVRIWDRALSQEEISAGMSRILERAPHLRARFGLDEVEGWTVTDSTGNQHLGMVHRAGVSATSLPPGAGGRCVYLEPQPVRSLSLETYPEPRWAWADQAGLRFDVVGGALSALRAGGAGPAAHCLGNDLATPRFVDSRPAPPPGEGHFLLIRSVGTCEHGSYGTDGLGRERVPLADCP